MLNRRVGRNELDTIQTLLAIVDAQREYAATDPDENGFADYARRFISTPARRTASTGPTKAGEPQSPLGPLVGAAPREGYGSRPSGAPPQPYHGYSLPHPHRAGQGRARAAPTTTWSATS